MKRSLRKLSRQWHRWLGIIVVIPLIIASVTGVILNHTVDFKLSERRVNAEWVLKRYGMTLNGEPIVWGGRDGVFAGQWDGQIFTETQTFSDDSLLVGAVALSDGIAVATEGKVYFYGLDGELVETLDELTLPAGEISQAGRSDDLRLVLEVANSFWIADQSLLEFSALESATGIEWSTAQQVDEAQKSHWKSLYAGGGVPADRVILDLHSGNLFGPVGKWIWDILVFGILILSLSGVVLFLKRKPQAKS